MIISRFLSFVVGAPWIPLQSSVNPPVHLRPRIPILQYCSDWVCVNKPAGISVHPNLSPSRRRRRNEEETHVLTSRLKRQLHRKVLPVHRLDHRTSGAILMAFTSETAAQLQTALHEGSKRYLALVRGEWTHVEPSITINTPILMHDIPKRACTKFTLIASRSGSPEFDFYDRCSLLWCEPLLTGRTHQIRRHAAAMGHPIVGDTEHGDTHINRWWRTTQGLDRLLLHCWSLDITKNWPIIGSSLVLKPHVGIFLGLQNSSKPIT
jgi:23S rRNA-/tRNA-specific pseudouridylate synthase